MNEDFTKLTRKQLIKMWRTMKAEAGSRRTSLAGTGNLDIVSIHELMERYEEISILTRAFHILKKSRWWRK